MSRRGLNDRPQCQGSLWLLKYKQWIEGLSTRLSHYCSTINELATAIVNQIVNELIYV